MHGAQFSTKIIEYLADRLKTLPDKAFRMFEQKFRSAKSELFYKALEAAPRPSPDQPRLLGLAVFVALDRIDNSERHRLRLAVCNQRQIGAGRGKVSGRRRGPIHHRWPR